MNRELFEKKMSAKEIAGKYGADEHCGDVMQRRFDISEHKRVLNERQDHVEVNKEVT